MFRFFKKIKKDLLYMGLEKEQYYRIRGSVDEDNKRSVFVWSGCAAIFWIFSLIMSLKSEAYTACRYVYVSALIIAFITLLLSKFMITSFPGMMHFTTYLFEASILGAGIGISINQPDVRTVSIIAFMLIIPTCTIDRTLTDVVLNLITLICYIIFAKGFVEPDVFSWELTNIIIFSTVGILISHVINKSRFERYVYAESIKEFAEIQKRYANYDELTGLKNRRAFIEEVDNIKENGPDDYIFIMADLNGLKVINDSKGHEAGDILLIGAKECLKDAFDNVNTIYRVGGDEFCIIMYDTEENVLNCLKKLETESAKWNRGPVNGVSIACGYAIGSRRSDAEEILIQADHDMYENKRKYYAHVSRRADK